MNYTDYQSYFRASARQLDYLDYLYKEANEINRSKYVKFSMKMATREINRLKRKINRNYEESVQTKLFELV